MIACLMETVLADRIKPLQMPVAPPLWGLASLKVTRADLRKLLGDPHYVETDSRRTCGGEQDAWAFLLSSGQRVLIIHERDWAEFCGDPPILEPILAELGISRSDSRLTSHAQPWEWK
jgi:hypothetical protein